MTKLGLLGAAAVILSSALASPVLAQQVITDPGYCAQFYPNANCQNNGQGNPYTGDYQFQNGWGSGYGGYGSTYARSWFVCQPGTYFMGEDGDRHICQ
jgi:hypothetical protein